MAEHAERMGEARSRGTRAHDGTQRTLIKVIVLLLVVIAVIVGLVLIKGSIPSDEEVAKREAQERAAKAALIARLNTPEIHRLRYSLVAIKSGDHKDVPMPAGSQVWMSITSGCATISHLKQRSMLDVSTTPQWVTVGTYCKGDQFPLGNVGNKIRFAGVKNGATLMWFYCPQNRFKYPNKFELSMAEGCVTRLGNGQLVYARPDPMPAGALARQ